MYIQRYSSDQLGPGAYISLEIAQWHMAGVNWDCAILADSTAWDHIDKALVPKIDDSCCDLLWWAGRKLLMQFYPAAKKVNAEILLPNQNNQNEMNRNEYLKSVGIPRFTTSNKVLLSQIERLGKLQLLILLMSIGMCGGLNIQMLRTAKTSQVAIGQVSRYSDVD